MLCSVCVRVCVLLLCGGLVLTYLWWAGKVLTQVPRYRSRCLPGMEAVVDDTWAGGTRCFREGAVAASPAPELLFSNTLSSVTGTSSPVACKALQRALR